MSTDATVEPVTLGQALVPTTFGPLSRTDLVRYAGASGDFTPMHHDETVAVALGYPTVFAMGMLPAGLLATFATDRLGASNLRRFSVRFREQVWPGDVLTLAGTIVGVDPTEDHDLVWLDLTATRADGVVVLTAKAEFLLSSKDLASLGVGGRS